MTTFKSHGLTIRVGQTLRLNGNKRRRHVVVSVSANSDKVFTVVDEKGTEMGLWDCGSHFLTLSCRRLSVPREAAVEVVAEPIVQA